MTLVVVEGRMTFGKQGDVGLGYGEELPKF
jgi:hypothetical protein